MEEQTRRNKKKMLEELMAVIPKCYICEKYYHNGFLSKEYTCRICEQCFCDNYYLFGDVFRDIDENYVREFDWRICLYIFYTCHNLNIDCTVLF
jgi:hypothetical protein